MRKIMNEKNASKWSQAVMSQPDRVLRFAINASLVTLPTNANLRKWKKILNSCCPLCQKTDLTLMHVLNICTAALNLHCYNVRHNNVLHVLKIFMESNIPTTGKITVDLEDCSYSLYVFPSHIVNRSIWRDILWWGDNLKFLTIFELTIHFKLTLTLLHSPNLVNAVT